MALLQLEAALGSRLPFRQAEEFLNLVTHGNVSIHDSTIAAHSKVIASAMRREWLYRRVPEIQKILVTRAIRDAETNRPLVFFSSDGHAERFYEGQGFKNRWRMVNGLRIWTIDEKTSRIIHLGGEFSMGDCWEFGEVLDALNALGVLPFDGDYDGVQAQIVFVADGMPWFDKHIRARFKDLGEVLDAFHLLAHVADFVAAVARRGSRRYWNILKMLKSHVVGKRAPNVAATKERSAKRPKQERSPRQRDYPEVESDPTAEGFRQKSTGATRLLSAIDSVELSKSARRLKNQLEAKQRLSKYVLARLDQTDYAGAHARNWPIGSGPMESFNRVAQSRLKVPGATWTDDMAQAMVNLRLLHASGRAVDFWQDPQIRADIEAAFMRAA